MEISSGYMELYLLKNLPAEKSTLIVLRSLHL